MWHLEWKIYRSTPKKSFTILVYSTYEERSSSTAVSGSRIDAGIHSQGTIDHVYVVVSSR